MARLADPQRDDLSAEAQATWDRIVESRGSVRGPFTVLMYVPALADRVGEVGDYLRFHGLLPAAERELATLTAGREVGARYAWATHEELARQAGLRPEAIEVVRAQGALEGLTARERTVVEIVRSLCREHAIADALFQRALAEFGREELVELVGLVGYYGLLGCILNGFEVEVPEGAPAPGF